MPNKKVIIIEDEVDLCLLLRDYFTRKHCDVKVSNTLAEGQAALKTINPDIVFLDNNLPDGAGWSLAPIIAVEHPGAYIVLVSAFHPSLPDMPENAKFWVIEKPIAFAELDKTFSGF